MDSNHHHPLPPLHATRPADEPRAVVVSLRGAISRADIPGLCARVRVLLDGSDRERIVCDVAGVTDPDCATVDALARLQLTATRLGSELRVRGASAELHDLLAMAGVCDVVGLCPRYDPS